MAGRQDLETREPALPSDTKILPYPATFHPVWEAKAIIDSLGWTTEIRIPFSQLRFTDQQVQLWGFNADHWNPATSEAVFWIPVPTNSGANPVN